eukprot:6186971-Pleurochrysis_carterae.AAC.1
MRATRRLEVLGVRRRRGHRRLKLRRSRECIVPLLDCLAQRVRQLRDRVLKPRRQAPVLGLRSTHFVRIAQPAHPTQLPREHGVSHVSAVADTLRATCSYTATFSSSPTMAVACAASLASYAAASCSS